MKKELIAAFLAGLVLPLALLLLQRPGEDLPEVESDALTTTQAQIRYDAAVMLTVKNTAGNLQQLPLDEYLVGVVLAEMPASFDAEALKAQAVVARTYTGRRMEHGKHDSAPVCMDSGCCQGYREPAAYLSEGGTEAALEKVRRAVAETDGQVLTYDGELIDATYFSCSGGSTEDAVAVWGQDVPYLQAVESPGEENAPRYSDSVTMPAAEVAEKLGISAAGKPSDWFGEVTYTEGGGVDTMVIQGKTFRGTAIRSALGLRSTAFAVSTGGDDVTFTTRGFGHRVGMSQYGAQAMAEGGSSYEAILSHYYTGAELTDGYITP